jgi:FADH2 O2-dependent halogenase
VSATGRWDAVVVGSGFAATILARILRRQGRSVLLVERARHPRFALGESSTPLANFCLERLAAAWDLPDLHRLAAYGRWSESFPGLRRGLKRGFTFYRHREGRRFANGPRNENRLLVAASPNERIADSHWLRADLDRHLARRAVAEGAELWEESEAGALEIGADGVRLEVAGDGGRRTVRASLLVDGSGTGGYLAERLGIPAVERPAGFDTRLIFGHFEGVGSFVESARAGGAEIGEGPYPDERAAVHHILDGGWMYVLAFDHGVVSAGFVIREDRPGRLAEIASELDPAAAWSALLRSYPTLERQFRDARPVRPVAGLRHLPRRSSRVAGGRWAMLPHAVGFLDPIYSTGIAWSLQGVEKLAGALSEWDPRAPGEAALLDRTLARYGAGVAREADQLRRLIDGAWLAMDDFDLLVHHSFLYFAVVSFLESRLRLTGAGVEMTNEGFLGAGDAQLEALFERARERLEEIAGATDAGAAEAREAYGRWVREAIAPWNVAGLADPSADNLYPVDLDLLVERAELLGMDERSVRAALPRLRAL